MARFLTFSACRSKDFVNSGFTLIDALISLLVISVSLTALLKFHWQVTRNSHETQIHNIALNLARQQLAELHNSAAINYELINNGSDNISLNYAKQPLKFKRNWQVTTNGTLDYKSITLNVSWEYRLSSRQLSLKTIIGRP